MAVRMQDRDGRGPFAPGLTRHWKRDEAPLLPPFFVELGIDPLEVPKRFPANGGWIGCACDGWKQFYQWFSLYEITTLSNLGFAAVEFEPDEILVVTPTQLVFRHMSPLSSLCRPPLPHGGE